MKRRWCRSVIAVACCLAVASAFVPAPALAGAAGSGVSEGSPALAGAPGPGGSEGSPDGAPGQVDPVGTPAPPTPEEAAVLQELFTLGRSLDETRTSVEQVNSQIQDLTAQQAAAAAERDRLEAQRKARQAQFGRRLRFYQEYGRVAPVAVLLGATSFSDFLSRLDSVSSILAYDNRLIRELRALNAAVAEKELTLRTSAEKLAGLQSGLLAQQAHLQAEIAQREAILAGLQEKRAAVEAQLAALEQTWTTEAQPVLEALGTTLLRMDQASFAPDQIKVSLFPPGAVAIVSAHTLNAFFGKEPALKGMTVRVSPGTVSLDGEFDGAAVKISGRFLVVNKTTLRFEPQQVQIRDFTVPPDSIQKYLAAGMVDIDVSGMVSPWSLQSVEMATDEIRIRAGL